MIKKQLKARGTLPVLSPMSGTLKQQALMMKEIIETAPCGIAFVSQDGRLSWMNAQFKEDFGYAKSEMEGMSIKNLVPLRLRSKQAQGQRKYTETPYVKKLGTGKLFKGVCKNKTEQLFEIGLSPFVFNLEHWTATWVVPAKSPQGGTQYSLLVEDMIEQAAEPICLIGKDYNVLQVNQAYEEAHDVAKNDLVGKPIANVLGDDVFQYSVKAFLNLCFAGETIQYYQQILLPNKETRMMLMNYFPIFSTLEDEIGSVLVMGQFLPRDDRKNKRQTSFQDHWHVSRGRENQGGESSIAAQEDSMAQKIRALSINQRAVLALVARGKTNKEIAEVLDLSEKTIRNNLTTVFRALGVSRRAEAVAVYVRSTMPPEKVGDS